MQSQRAKIFSHHCYVGEEKRQKGLEQKLEGAVLMVVLDTGCWYAAKMVLPRYCQAQLWLRQLHLVVNASPLDKEVLMLIHALSER